MISIQDTGARRDEEITRKFSLLNAMNRKLGATMELTRRNIESICKLMKSIGFLNPLTR